MIADDEGLIVAGSARSRILLARLSSNGLIDPSWGAGGVANPPLGNHNGTRGSRYAEANAVTRAEDGSFVVVGSNANPQQPGSHGLPCQGCWEAVLGRFGADGAPATGFGRNGFLRLFGGGRQRLSKGAAAAALAGGATLASGAEVGGRQSMLVSRYLPDGSLTARLGTMASPSSPPPRQPGPAPSPGLPPVGAGRPAHPGACGAPAGAVVAGWPSLRWARIEEVVLRVPPALQPRLGSDATGTVISDGYREPLRMEEGKSGDTGSSPSPWARERRRLSCRRDSCAE